MMIKSLSGVLCGLLVACGGAAQAPIARVAVIDSCAGTPVHSTAITRKKMTRRPVQRASWTSGSSVRTGSRLRTGSLLGGLIALAACCSGLTGCGALVTLVAF